MLATKGADTKLVDLGGKFVMPGLIDSHTHPTGAAMHEFDHPVPDMETIADVLAYIKSRAADSLPEGSWISVRQIFITRLKEQRYPSRAELDAGRAEASCGLLDRPRFDAEHAGDEGKRHRQGLQARRRGRRRERSENRRADGAVAGRVGEKQIVEQVRDDRARSLTGSRSSFAITTPSA